MVRSWSSILPLLITVAACGGELVPGVGDGDDARALTTPAVAPWAKPRQNARNTAASSLGAATADVRWRYQATAGGLGTNVNSDPVIDGAGNVYFGGREGATSLTPAGAVRWTFRTPPSTVVYGVQLVSDGSVLVNASNGALYSVDQQTGAYRWGITTGTTGQATPLVVGPDRTIYFGSQSTNELVAVDGNAKGALKWRARLAGPPVGLPALRSDGLVYVAVGAAGNAQVGVQMIDPRRKRAVWTWWAPRGTAAFLGGVVVTASDGALVAGYAYGTLFALDPKRPGGVAWTWQSPSDVDFWAAPALGPDGTIYLAEGGVLGKDGDKRVLALTPAGALKWATTVRGNVNVAPALSRAGLLYVASMAELPKADAELRLTAIRAATGAIAWSVELPADGVWPSVSVAPALANGRVYLGVNDGYTDGLAQSGSLWAIGAEAPLADAGEPDPVPPPTTRAATVAIDTTLYSPQMGFVAWLPRGSAILVDTPPFDVAPRAGFTWAWFGDKEGWVQASVVRLK
jgi:outer membrane protein assembly factor BamB